MTKRKATCTQSDLAACLAVLSKCAMTKSAYNPLTCILIEHDRNGVKLTASDYKTTMQFTVAGTCDEGFRSLVAAKLFTQLVGNLSGGAVELTQTGHKLLVKAGTNTATFNVVPDDDYYPLNSHPTFAAPAVGPKYDWFLASVLQRGGYAAATDDSRPTLCGIKLEMTKHELAVVSTDGYRLSRQRIETLSETDATCIIPAEMARLITALKSYETPTLELYNDWTKLRFSAFGADQAPYRMVIIDTVLIDANYPDYTAIIPDHDDTVAIADVAELLNAVRVASLMTVGPVTLSIAADTISVSGKDPEYGDSVSVIDADVTGEPIDAMGIDPKFLRDALSHIHTETVRCGFCGANRPVVITPDSDVQRDSQLHLIMPMQVRN